MKKLSMVLCVLFLLTILFIPRANADTPPNEITKHKFKYGTSSPWFGYKHDSPYLTGDWWGLREELEEKGITISSSYVMDVLGNTTGGKYQAVRYDHSWGFDSNFDLEKLMGLEGLQFHFSWIWREGQNLSSDAIRNQFNVTSIFGSEQFRIYGLYLDQSLFDKKLSIRAGRIATGDDFAMSPIYWIYMNNAIDGCPISLPLNLPFITYPTATWGVRTIWKPYEWLDIRTGVYNGDGKVGRMSAHGADFSLKLHRGVMLVKEINFLPGHAEGSEWLPGTYRVGGYWHTGKFFDLYKNVDGNSFVTSGKGPRKHNGNYGLYTHFDQMIYVEDKEKKDQGLTVFLATTWAQSDLNQLPFFVDGGIFYKGLIPKRDDDITAWAFAYGKWSNDLANSQRDDRDFNGALVEPQSYELMFEFTYKAMITKWFFIQPDMQIIINPMGTQEYKNAFVIGSRVGVTF